MPETQEEVEFVYIEILKPRGRYTKGDRIKRPRPLAQALIKQGAAKEYTPSTPGPDVDKAMRGGKTK